MRESALSLFSGWLPFLFVAFPFHARTAQAFPPENTVLAEFLLRQALLELAAMLDILRIQHTFTS